MASRKVLGIGRTHLVMLAGVPMATYTVYAAEGSSPKSRKIKANELPLYGNPEVDNQYEFVPEQISPFRASISSIRQSVWKYLDSIKETTDYVEHVYQTGKAHTLGFIDYVQSDPGILPRAGVITVAGLGGIVAGYRGGILRKVTYSSVAMLSAASLCYPDKAVEITTSAYDTVVREARGLWKGEDSKIVETVKSEIPAEIKQPDRQILKKIEEIETHVLQKPSKIVEDFGQSKPEDKDMYTTRS
ncbi:MICOS complex subunit MIC27-like [Liolophura sinensis]|uniref:MICOS complex subunit MIC27-like n=1 Tax=Liolophura sinensis TaxID=3198878 RepID=UPI003158CF87